MKWFMKILGIAGIVLCLCGFVMAGIGYAFGGMDYIREENLTDIKNVFFGHIETAPDHDGIKVDVGDIQTGDMQEDSNDRTLEEKKEIIGTDDSDVSVWELVNLNLESVSSIKADLDCIDLKIGVSEDKDFHLSYKLYCMNRKDPLSYNLENGTLKLTETDFIPPSFKKGFWNIGNITNKYESFIKLYVPSDSVLKSCNFNIGDSDLTINGFHCNTMDIETAAGDMSVKESSFSKTAIKTIDGDIVFSNTSISGDLQIETADGDISASDLSTKGIVQLSTTDGDVSFSRFKTSKGMEINAVDGDISISKLTASGAVNLTTVDGDITISDFTESDGAYIQTGDGEVSANALDITGKLQIDAKDGDVLLSGLGVSGKVEIACECGDILAQLQKKSLSDLKITMDTEEGELSAAHSLGGKKSGGHYERRGSMGAYLKGYTEEGDISIQ